MKLLFIAILFSVYTMGTKAHADSTSTYIRGSLFALDTREQRICAEFEEHLQGFARQQQRINLCNQDSRAPFAIVLLYAEVDELHFRAEATEWGSPSDVIVPIKPDKEIGHSSRLFNNQNNIVEVVFYESLPNVTTGLPAVLQFHFLMKTSSGTQDLLFQILNFKAPRSSIDDQAKEDDDDSISLYELINQAFQKAISNKRTYVNLYKVPGLQCPVQVRCPYETDLRIGIKILILF